MISKRISNNLLTEVEDIILTILPFLLFICFYMPFKAGGDVWNLWFSISRVLAFILIIGIIVLLILKKYNKYYFFVWAGLANYFSLSFIFQNWSTRSLGHYGYDFWYHATVFLQGHGLPLPSEIEYPIHIFPTMNLLILFISLLLFVGLFSYLKLELIKKILFVTSYYFVYCYFLFLQYQTKIGASDHYEGTFRSFIIFNSIIAGIFIYLFIRTKKNIHNILLLVLYLVLNFVAINIYRIRDIYINKNYFIIGNSQFNELLQIVIAYIIYFLLYSNILYLVIIIYGIDLIAKHNKIDLYLA